MAIKMNSNPSKTVLTITVGFLIVYAVSGMKWVLSVTIAVGLAGILSSFLAEKIEWIWMKLTWVLSLIVPNILLGAVFYIFLFPVALLAKLFSRKNALQLKDHTDSVYIETNKTFTNKDFENPW
jgi:hypothetical protein